MNAIYMKKLQDISVKIHAYKEVVDVEEEKIGEFHIGYFLKKLLI